MAARITLTVEEDLAAVPAADPAWRGLYVAGGVSAWLYVLLAVVVPGVMTTAVDDFWGTLVDGPALLALVAEERVWWHLVQGLVLQSSIFAIVAFVALAVALGRADRVWATLGVVVSVTVQLLFMAYYPVLLGLGYLAGQSVDASVDRQRELAVAADALIAQNSGFNPVYEVLMGIGVLLLAVALLRSPVLPRWLGVLGVATCVASVVGVALYSVVGLLYFLWWALFVAWFLGVGWELLRLARRLPRPRER